MSSLNAAKQPDSKAFDDLLGRLVDELAMSPALPQPDPAPQLVRAPEPVEHGATAFVAPPVVPTRPNRTPIAVAAIIAGSIVALGVAAMLILPRGPSAAPDDAPVSAPAPVVAAPAPTAVPPAPAPVAVPATPEPVTPPPSTPELGTAANDPAATSGAPTPKPPDKKPRKRPPTKKRPPGSGDGFDDL